MSDWHLIETAPKDRHVIFWTVQQYQPPDFVTPNLGSLHFGKYGSWSSLERATHWMPLPDPPPQCPFGAGTQTGAVADGWWPCSCGAEHAIG